MNIGRTILMAGILLSQAVFAHRDSTVFSDIMWSGDRFEIVHEMHLADALRVADFLKLGGEIDQLRNLASMALYVEHHFDVAREAGSTPINTIGAEIDGDTLYVYQEWVTPLQDPFPKVTNTLLVDVIPKASARWRVLLPSGVHEFRRD
jgi:hypothetical protein